MKQADLVQIDKRELREPLARFEYSSLVRNRREKIGKGVQKPKKRENSAAFRPNFLQLSEGVARSAGNYGKFAALFLRFADRFFRGFESRMAATPRFNRT